MALPEPNSKSLTIMTNAARDAQLRRRHEKEAREVLQELLPSSLFNQELQNRSDLNVSAKVLFAALQYIDANITINEFIPRNISTRNSAQYAQLRRSVEAQIRDDLKARIPEEYFFHEIMNRSYWNQTTKMLVILAVYIEKREKNEYHQNQEHRTEPMLHEMPDYLDKNHPPKRQKLGKSPKSRDDTAPVILPVCQHAYASASYATKAYDTLPPPKKTEPVEPVRQLEPVVHRLLQEIDVMTTGHNKPLREIQATINQASDFMTDFMLVLKP